MKIYLEISKWLAGWAIAGFLVISYQPFLLAETTIEPTIHPEIPDLRVTRLEVSLRQRQVILYRGSAEVKSYPVAIGKAGWETPTGNFTITQMLPNPAWKNPITDDILPPGDPENPLGPYWIGFWTEGWIWYGFHGTNEPESVGQAITHGCLRMYNNDVEELFSQVSLGTVVMIRE
jgi:lipoprotein-anchoring transpeptidase ErfK/SrfK